MSAALRRTALLALAFGLPNESWPRLGAQTVHPSVTLMAPRGKTRVVDFETDEGTDLSVSVAPDGRWLAFDLLGHVYRLPIDGGRAVALTQNSGGALNFHPAISPDGKRIAFISDRQGQNNVWVMNADGSNPRPVFLDPETRFTEPAWSPDGRSIAAVRAFPTPGRGWHRQYKEMWLLPLDGGAPKAILSGRLEHYESPRFSPDGKYLYYHVSYSIGEGLGMLLAGHRLQRLELATGQRTNVRTTDPTQLSPEFVAALKSGGYASDVGIDPPAALAPAVSPDNSTVAFALEEPGETFSFRGHEFGPRTGLYVRNLETGAERRVIAPITKELTQVNAQYYYRVIPAFSWTPDGRSVVLAYGGKLHRVDVATGADSPIPFTARVRRVLSEQPRSAIRISDRSVAVRFIQWPAGSPDGRRVAFVAVGRIWVMDRVGGKPRALATAPPNTIQLTPAWSPDGREIAFTTWNDRERGAVWKVRPTGGEPTKLTTEPGEYIYPAWAPDGRSLVITRGPGPQPPIGWNGWETEVGWRVARIPAAGGAVEDVAPTGTLQSSAFAADGRLLVTTTGEGRIPAGTGYVPFPAPDIRDRPVRVQAVGPSGPPRELVRLPIQAGATLGRPAVSPDGKWVAFEADRTVFVRPLPAAASDSAPWITTDPNVADPARIQVGSFGGLYHRWTAGNVLELAAGPRYVTFDPATRRLTVTPIALSVPRPAPTGTIAFTNAKIVTMEPPAEVIERGTIVVRGSRIACVGRCDPSGADRVVDLEGKTVIPGLVDVHAHHTTGGNGVVVPRRWQSALDLAYGVTTIVDPATESDMALPLAEMVAAGVVTGPRTFSSTETVISPGRAWGEHRLLRSLADARYEVGRRKDWGAIEIKNFRQSSRRRNQLVIEAGRQLGITVTSEGGPLFFDVGLTIDGQTGWEHLLAPIPLYRDASTFFGKAGMVYSPTSIVAGHVNGSMEYFRPRQNLLDDAKYNRFIPRSYLELQYQRSRMVPLTEVSFPLIAEGLRDIVRAGGYGAIGEHGEQMGIGSHWEIWAYASALTPLEALRVATWDGAYFMGLHHEIGSIKAGKLADLVVLNADPLADIRNTANIQSVMRHGILYDDDTLDEVWPERRAYGDPPWR
jgi:Tol biopolymer transport system component